MYFLPVGIHVTEGIVYFVPLVRFISVGHSLGLAEVRCEAVIPHLGLIEIHLYERQQHLWAEALHLTILDTRVEPGLGLADPHHIIEAVGGLEVTIGEVQSIQLIRGKCPVLSICHSALSQSLVT